MGSSELDASGSGWEEGPADEDKEDEEDDKEEVEAVAAVVVVVVVVWEFKVVGVADCSASILAPC